MSGRTIAIGDIHGCDTALDVLLASVVPSPEDTFVVLGDVIDRGPGSRQAVERLIRLAIESRVVLVMGNHEEMLLDALGLMHSKSGLDVQDWLRYGGLETLASYGGDIQNIPHEHLEFLGMGRDVLETDSHIFIHANLEPAVPLDRQTPDWLRWTHLTGFEQPHASGKRIVCGHTPQRSGTPLVLPGWACIDTLAFAGGWLTALDTGTGEIFQANQAGKSRTSWIRE